MSGPGMQPNFACRVVVHRMLYGAVMLCILHDAVRPQQLQWGDGIEDRQEVSLQAALYTLELVFQENG